MRMVVRAVIFLVVVIMMTTMVEGGPPQYVHVKNCGEEIPKLVEKTEIYVASTHFFGPVIAEPFRPNELTPTDRPNVESGLLCPFECTVNALFVRHQGKEKSVSFGRWWAPVTKPKELPVQIPSTEYSKTFFYAMCPRLRYAIYQMVDKNTLNVCHEFLGGSQELFRAVHADILTGVCGWTNTITCSKDGTVLPIKPSFQIFIPPHFDKKFGNLQETEIVTHRAQVVEFVSGCNCQSNAGEAGCTAQGDAEAEKVLSDLGLQIAPVQAGLEELEHDMSLLLSQYSTH